MVRLLFFIEKKTRQIFRNMLSSKKERRMLVQKNDFTKGSVSKTILRLALPMTIAQLINVLYNIVDRIYIGRIGDGATLALSGIGITFPMITIIIAFANLFGMGGAPLCSIERGKGNLKKAEAIMGNSFTMLLISGGILTVLCFLLKRDILYLFGASDTIYPYANDYISIYLCGSIFVMIGLGMNSFINSQGFAKFGMMTVMIGAILNIMLDPIFIFALDLGVKGAALATILSQLVSAIWVLYFLCGKETILTLKKEQMKLQWGLVKEIIQLGMSGFVMAITNSSVQIVCNSTLQFYGGDIYIGIMTIINSVREVITMPVNGLTNGAQPVLGYNYGAKEYGRVKQAIKFMSLLCVGYTFIMWLFILWKPALFIRIFNDDPQTLEKGVMAMQVFFFGYFFMSLQFSGQSVFLALNQPKQAIFFSIFRKIIIVVPLTLWLPTIAHLGVVGVFLAEPISNLIGGSASFLTMLVTIWPKLKQGRSASEKQFLVNK